MTMKQQQPDTIKAPEVTETATELTDEALGKVSGGLTKFVSVDGESTDDRHKGE